MEIQAFHKKAFASNAYRHWVYNSNITKSIKYHTFTIKPATTIIVLEMYSRCLVENNITKVPTMSKDHYKIRIVSSYYMKIKLSANCSEVS